MHLHLFLEDIGHLCFRRIIISGSVIISAVLSFRIRAWADHWLLSWPSFPSFGRRWPVGQVGIVTLRFGTLGLVHKRSRIVIELWAACHLRPLTVQIVGLQQYIRFIEGETDLRRSKLIITTWVHHSGTVGALDNLCGPRSCRLGAWHRGKWICRYPLNLFWWIHISMWFIKIW